MENQVSNNQRVKQIMINNKSKTHKSRKLNNLKKLIKFNLNIPECPSIVI